MPIYYESRISKLALNAAELPKLDAGFENFTECEELTQKENSKTKWVASVVAGQMLAERPSAAALIRINIIHRPIPCQEQTVAVSA